MGLRFWLGAVRGDCPTLRRTSCYGGQADARRPTDGELVLGSGRWREEEFLSFSPCILRSCFVNRSGEGVTGEVLEKSSWRTTLRWCKPLWRAVLRGFL